MRKLALKQTPGVQHLVRAEQKTKTTPEFVWLKHRAYNFSAFLPGWVPSCKIEFFKASISKFTLFVLTLNSIYYASFGNNVWGFRGGIYSSSRVNLKLHEHSENLARTWKTQNSPRLLPAIYSMLRLKYAEPSKFTVFEIDFKRTKTLQQKKFIVWRSKETLTQKFPFCKGAKKLRYTKTGSNPKK